MPMLSQCNLSVNYVELSVIIAMHTNTTRTLYMRRSSMNATFAELGKNNFVVGIDFLAFSEHSFIILRLRSKLCIKSHMKKRHMAGEEEPCHICGKVVKYKRMHFLYHQEDYKTRYKCSECGKGFATKTKLKVQAKSIVRSQLFIFIVVFLFVQEHSGIHSGILHHKCPFCDETFRFGSSVSIHKKKWHSDRL